MLSLFIQLYMYNFLLSLHAQPRKDHDYHLVFGKRTTRVVINKTKLGTMERYKTIRNEIKLYMREDLRHHKWWWEHEEEMRTRNELKQLEGDTDKDTRARLTVPRLRLELFQLWPFLSSFTASRKRVWKVFLECEIVCTHEGLFIYFCTHEKKQGAWLFFSSFFSY